MRRLRELLRSTRSAGKSIRRNAGGFLAAIASIAVALSMTGIALLLEQQVDKTKGEWYDKAGITLYFCTQDSTSAGCLGEPDAAAKQQTAELLAQQPWVEAVYYETRQQAWEDFSEKFAGTEIARSVTPEALPESLRVRAVDGTDQAAALAALGTPPGVEKVVDQRASLSGFFRVVSGLQLAAGIFALVQAAATAALVGNLVRASLRQRRNEVRIMDLVGAPARVVRAPFVIESVTVCALGAVVATGVLALGTAKLLPMLAGSSGMETVTARNAVSLGYWLLGAAILVGWLVSRVSLRLAGREKD